MILVEIKKAIENDMNSVYKIVNKTINEIYYKYLSNAIIDYFFDLHSEEKILNDIKNQNVYVFQDHGETFATATCEENLIKRLYVLPEFEGNGYGSSIMDFLENKISANYAYSLVDGVDSSMKFYLKRGYYTIDNIITDVGNQQQFYYERLRKDLNI